MNKEILMAVDAVSNEKGVDKEIIFDALEGVDVFGMCDLNPGYDLMPFLKQLNKARLATFNCLKLKRRLLVQDYYFFQLQSCLDPLTMQAFKNRCDKHERLPDS